MKYLKEITDWSDCGCNVPNHTYIFNEKNQNVGYIKTGTKEEIFYKSPSKLFCNNTFCIYFLKPGNL